MAWNPLCIDALLILAYSGISWILSGFLFLHLFTYLDRSDMTTHATDDYGLAKKSLLIYSLGFLLSILLTLIPFHAVYSGSFPKHWLLLILFISAIIQCFVHILCFLRVNLSTTQAKVNTLTLIFSLVVTITVIGGSLWIMSNLNYFMMHWYLIPRN